MTFGNPIIGTAPIKSTLSHTVDIPFVVDLTDVDSPFIVNSLAGFSVEPVYIDVDDDPVLVYWAVTILNTFYAYLSMDATIRIAQDQAAACLGSVQTTVPTCDPTNGVQFNFFITGPSVNPTNFNGVSFLLRGTTWSYNL